MSLSPLETVRAMLAAIEADDEAALAAVLADEIVQTEHPNQLVPQGAVRDRAAMLAGLVAGRRAVRDQRYELLRAVSEGETVACELLWTATLKVPVLGRQAGDVLHARFAIFAVVREGKIVEQVNYDCFLPS